MSRNHESVCELTHFKKPTREVRRLTWGTASSSQSRELLIIHNFTQSEISQQEIRFGVFRSVQQVFRFDVYSRIALPQSASAFIKQRQEAGGAHLDERFRANVSIRRHS